jgi:cyclic-di-GMP-binding protein
MRNLDAVPIPPGPVSQPLIADVHSCEQWLSRARLADPHQACASFVMLLDELEDAPPAGTTYLQILERLRPPMLAALVEQQKRFAARPLPLGPAEAAAFVQAIDLWLAMLRAWRTLVRASKKEAPRTAGVRVGVSLADDRPLLSSRILECSAGLISAHFAGRQDVDESVWHWVHQSYAFAEGMRVTEEEIAGQGASCMAIYAELLLVSLAHPYSLSQRELAWTWRWAKRWSSKVKLWRAAENGGGYAVDLDGCAGPAWTRAGEPGGALRFIECSEVARSIRRRLRKLGQGVEPVVLGLGRDCTRPAAEDLLRSLLRCWTDAPIVRQFPRRPATDAVQLWSGFASIHEAVSGKPFESAAKHWQYNRRAAEQIHIFQRAIDVDYSAPRAAPAESWEAVDESANGFRLRRGSVGQRLAHRQLVALQPGGSQKPLLGEVRWLFESRDHSLDVGVKALPGLPQACAVRVPTADTSRPPEWSPAFLVAAGGAEPDTLVIPIAWFQPGRPLELRSTDSTRVIHLEALIDRGNDFDHVRFS